MRRSYGRDRWTNAHEIERLDQLIYDLRMMRGRYVDECLKAAEWASGAERAGWEQAAQTGEATLCEMEDRCTALLERYGREHGTLDG